MWCLLKTRLLSNRFALPECRKFCVTVANKCKVKNYDDIPGPRGPLGLGNIFNYFPVIGSYRWTELHKAGLDKYKKYGSLVKEAMVPGTDIVWLYDPNDIAIVLNDSSTKEFPQRRSHLALAKYRQDRPHIYRSAGLLPTNGSEWWRLRSELQKELSSPKNVRSFLPDVDSITNEFVHLLEAGIIVDMLPELHRLNLELTCLLVFDERMDSFSQLERHSNSRTSRLIRSTEETNSCILPTDQGFQLWRYFETPTFRKLRKAQEYMENVAVDLVSEKITYFKEESDSIHRGNMSRSSLLEEYLKNPNLDLSDIVGMAADLVLAGIDTTSYTTSFAVYHLARSKEVQERIFEESLSILQHKDDPITEEALKSKIPYTRAVLKEVFRLNPVSVGVGRILNKDLVLGEHLVPKGTVVVTQNMVACRLEKNFENPEEFDPERWLNRKNPVNPYLVLPFGHGMRACIARRLAEQNILVFLLRFFRNYRVKWMGTDTMDVRTLLINKPDQPVNVLLKSRD